MNLIFIDMLGCSTEQLFLVLTNLDSREGREMGGWERRLRGPARTRRQALGRNFSAVRRLHSGKREEGP